MWRWFVVLALAVGALGWVPATAGQDALETQEETHSVDRSSPRAVLRSFLDAMHTVDEGNPAGWAQAVACLDLSEMAVQAESIEARELAVQLYGVINRIEYVDLEGDTVPGGLYFGDGWMFYPRAGAVYDAKLREELAGAYHIHLERAADGGGWWFDAETVAGVGEAYEKIKHLPSVSGDVIADAALLGQAEDVGQAEGFIKRLMPESWKGAEILSLAVWQWVGLLVLTLFAVTFDLLTRFAMRFFAARVLRRVDAQADHESIVGTMRPLGFFMAGLSFALMLPWLELPALPQMVLMGAAKVFATMAGMLCAWRATDLVAQALASKAAKTTTKFDDVLIPLIRKTIKVFVVIFGLIYGAQALNIPIAPLLASLTVAGVGFSFAAKDTFENLFGSVTVLIDRPFDVGDWVVVGDTEGTVEEVGFRSTRIRTFYNSQVTIPNGNLVRAVVDNYGRRKYRRWKTSIGVQYDTTPEQLVAFSEGIREIVRTHPYTRKDYFQVRVHGFGDSAINVLLYIFHEVPDWSTELRERERLMLDIMRLADALGVQFAFPTQTVHLFKEEDRPYEKQHAVPQSMTERRAMVVGIRQAQELMAHQTWQKTKPGPVTYPVGPTELSEEDAELSKYETTEDTVREPGT